MGFDLRRMIRDGAPPEWTPLMRDVAKEIADSAHDPGPDNPPLPDGQWPWSPLHVEGYWDRKGVWRDGLVEICGATPRAISDALTRLGRWGYEMRQPITDRHGKPVLDRRGRVLYAASGHALRLWVPPLHPRPEPERSHQSATNAPERSHEDATFGGDSTHHDASNVIRSSHQSASTGPERSHPDVEKVAPQCDPISSGSPQLLSPQKNQSPQPPLLAVVAGTEGNRAEAEDERSMERELRDQACRYAQCRQSAAVPSGREYHAACELLAEIKARPHQHPDAMASQDDGGEAA